MILKRLLTVYQSKWSHESIKAAGNDRKAFRSCIHADDRHRLGLLGESLSPDSVTISDWFFKFRTDVCVHSQEIGWEEHLRSK